MVPARESSMPGETRRGAWALLDRTQRRQVPSVEQEPPPKRAMSGLPSAGVRPGGAAQGERPRAWSRNRQRSGLAVESHG